MPDVCGLEECGISDFDVSCFPAVVDHSRTECDNVAKHTWLRQNDNYSSSLKWHILAESLF